MTEDVLVPRRSSRSFVRRVVYPVLVIVAIIAVIYYIENRNGDSTNSSGQTYGIREMSPALNPDGMNVEAAEGSLAPDFELETVAISGSSTTNGEAWLSDYRGHPVVLNFWATWCYPCRKEIPQFVKSADKYNDDGLVVIGLDLQEGPGLIQPFAQEYGMNYPILVDRDGEVGNKYRLLGMPTTVFIDANGVVRKIFRGPLQEGSAPNGTDVQGAIGASDLEAGIAQIIAVGTPTPGANSGSR
jgi:thiol-disulfide isomerase/thioredoxin